MKKSQILILIVVIAVIVIGVVLVMPKNKSGEESVSSTELTEQATAPANSEVADLPNQEVSNESFRCTYTVEGGLHVTTYSKGENIRTEVQLPDGDTNISIYSNDKVYQWSEKAKQGVVISIADAKKQPGTEVQDPKEYLDEMKQTYHPDCQNMDLASSLFAVPRDVDFQDLSEALK